MKKIICGAKIALGTAMVLAAAYSLSPFGGFLDLILGTGLMLAGIVTGILLERNSKRLFFLFSLLSLLLTFSLYFFPFLSLIRYFPGGLLIYFACAIASDRKRTMSQNS
jgi:hypothetical protein